MAEDGVSDLVKATVEGTSRADRGIEVDRSRGREPTSVASAETAATDAPGQLVPSQLGLERGAQGGRHRRQDATDRVDASPATIRARYRSAVSPAVRGSVQTVLGPVNPDHLGVTQTHEHLVIDLVGRMGPRAETPEELARWDEPITLENLYEVRRFIRLFAENLRLDDLDLAAEELRAFAAAGGGTVVDLTTIDLGRDPAALERISRETGVRIVMGTAYYVHDFHPPEIAQMSEEELAGVFVRDLTEAEPRAGIVGEIGMTWPHHPDEVKVLRAAVRAQRETGAPLSIHPGRDPRAPLAAVDVVEDAGGDPARTVVGHIDRTLTRREDIHALADRGVYLEFDLFGQESSYYDLDTRIDMPNDAARIDHVASLLERGDGDRVLLSQDICRKAHLRRYGGEGYGHLLSHVVPMMRRKGLSEDEIEALLIDNPARLLTIA
jgi:phosphotriesterase-related protein